MERLLPCVTRFSSVVNGKWGLYPTSVHPKRSERNGGTQKRPQNLKQTPAPLHTPLFTPRGLGSGTEVIPSVVSHQEPHPADMY